MFRSFISIVRPNESGIVTRLIRYSIINWRPGKFFLFYFNDKISQEEHKTICSSLRISGMALAIQNDLPAFFSPRKVNLKICLIPEEDLWENGQIPKDDFPRMATPWLMTSRNLNRWFDETSNLQPSSGTKRTRLVVSRNWGEFLIWLSRYWNMLVSHYYWTKPFQKFLSHTKLCSFHDCIIKLAGPPVYYSLDQLSLISPSSSNGWTIQYL